MLGQAVLSADDVPVKSMYARDPQTWQEVAFGVIELDENDVVLTYNRAESALARRDPSEPSPIEKPSDLGRRRPIDSRWEIMSELPSSMAFRSRAPG